MVTAVWLSASGRKYLRFPRRDGRIPFDQLGESPRRVSIPKDSGVTSSAKDVTDVSESTPAWMAAPIATASSGFTDLSPSFPVNLFTNSCTVGILSGTACKNHSFIYSGRCQVSVAESIFHRVFPAALIYPRSAFELSPGQFFLDVFWYRAGRR